ncbi:hypothetical protein G6O69_20785 [Pseudenhygromyxa sp. WMMC2535]|uniref:hypothetical protein n=1 Tax=Pseudenhygromyxa sp. WMMC2535 TaxID=2712867 RepID=UPI0015563BD7|nr:hypothetical protein [Pseudenhygromyxa sp. WMMC2535]NVB40291.1 hypothetical protein [Pseudenhygromyxa sp. WMMC2535]
MLAPTRPRSLAASFIASLAAASLLTGAGTARAATAPADAQDPSLQDPEQSDEAGRYGDAALDAFQSGDYQAAIENFERAFELSNNPNNLFNIGRVYEEWGKLELAVEHYKKFLAQPGVSLEYRKAALERLEVLEKTIAATKAGEAEAEPQPEPPAPVVDAGGDSSIDAGPQPDTERRRKQRNAGYALLGVGGVALIAGGIVGGLTASTSASLRDEADPERREQLVDRGNTLAPTADALLISGATLAVVGLIVTLTALPKRGQQSKATALAPSFGSHGGGLTLVHRF